MLSLGKVVRWALVGAVAVGSVALVAPAANAASALSVGVSCDSHSDPHVHSRTVIDCAAFVTGGNGNYTFSWNPAYTTTNAFSNVGCALNTVVSGTVTVTDTAGASGTSGWRVRCQGGGTN